MSTLVPLAAQSLALPAPRVALSIRPATVADVPFMDTLQRQHARQLGYFPTKQFEGYVELGGVLIAEDSSNAPLGYCVWRDRYLKRDELGVIYQLCVAPGDQRKLIGASLLKAVFDRSAYGCRLYCCWCAQDLPANLFWESMGFVPIAYRGGSEKKKGLRGGGRVHIFWQKRIRAGDVSTPWWFPAKTEGGAMREDRLVLPIPPRLHWSDEMPVLHAGPEQPERPEQPAPRSKIAGNAPKAPVAPVKRKRVRVCVGPPPRYPVSPNPAPPAPAPDAKAPEAKPRREKRKCDPKLIAAARELRDRYLEEVNRDGAVLLPAAKYDVARQLPDNTVRVEVVAVEPKQLPHAA